MRLTLPKYFRAVFFAMVGSSFIMMGFQFYKRSLGCIGFFRDCYLDGAGNYWLVDYSARLLFLLSIFLILLGALIWVTIKIKNRVKVLLK